MKARTSIHYFKKAFWLYFAHPCTFCALTADVHKLISCFILQLDCALFCMCTGTYPLLMVNQTFPNERGTVYFAGALIREMCAASLGTASS